MPIQKFIKKSINVLVLLDISLIDKFIEEKPHRKFLESSYLYKFMMYLDFSFNK